MHKNSPTFSVSLASYTSVGDSKVLEDWLSKEFISNPLIFLKIKLDYPGFVPDVVVWGFSFPRALPCLQFPLPLETCIAVALGKELNFYPILCYRLEVLVVLTPFLTDEH